MKRKLIEIYQENLIQCDNPNCDFKIKNPTGDPNEDSSMYLNVACPLCGDNLLTERDNMIYQSFMKKVNWINKWFSWVNYLIPFRKKLNEISTNDVNISFHEDIKWNFMDNNSLKNFSSNQSIKKLFWTVGVFVLVIIGLNHLTNMCINLWTIDKLSESKVKWIESYNEGVQIGWKAGLLKASNTMLENGFDSTIPFELSRDTSIIKDLLRTK